MRIGLVAYVNYPDHMGVVFAPVGDGLVGHHEQAAVGKREAGVGVTADFPVQVRDRGWCRQLTDIEDHHPRVPEPYIGPIAVAERMGW